MWSTDSAWARSLAVAPEMTTLLNRAHQSRAAFWSCLGGVRLRAWTQAVSFCLSAASAVIWAVERSRPLEVASDRITWSQFAWENGREPAGAIETAPASIAFRSGEYEEVFASAYRRVAALPFDELAHQERKPVWPWQWGWRLPQDGQ